jgi:hypothetical protein
LRTKLTDRLLHEVGDLPADTAASLAWVLVCVLTQKPPPQSVLRSVKDLKRFFSNPSPWSTRRFHPPLPGGAAIEPLTTTEAILEEGRLQRNCIGMEYVRLVQQGGAFLYKVTQPARCTLLIKRDARDTAGWAVAEVKAFANGTPDAATM